MLYKYAKYICLRLGFLKGDPEKDSFLKACTHGLL